MSKHVRPLLAIFALAVVILACTIQVPGIPPASTPVPNSGTATPPFSSGDVGTAVAQTLTAAVSAPVQGSATVPGPTMVPGAPSGSLPHSLYYLAPDSAGITQVFRLETDGTTQRQVTTETVSVTDYDVSSVDGAVAFVANNQLVYVNANGSERRVLVDGGVVDPNNPFITLINSPVFALDGQTLAFGHQGLRIYSFAEDKSNLLLENQIDDVGGGLFVPRELYWPERYSPDGTKLLITLGYYEGASSAVYYPATNALVRLSGGEGALICCEDVEWSSDSSSLYAASASAGMFSPGLWKVDAATGEVTTLIQGTSGDGNFNAARDAYLAPDGQLYFFFGTVSSPEGMFNHAPLQLVRSDLDGVTGRTVLREDTFDMLNEALWAPDASLAVVALASAPEIYQGGQAEIVYVDGRPRTILVPFAQQMKWGP